MTAGGHGPAGPGVPGEDEPAQTAGGDIGGEQAAGHTLLQRGRPGAGERVTGRIAGVRGHRRLVCHAAADRRIPHPEYVGADRHAGRVAHKERDACR